VSVQEMPALNSSWTKSGATLRWQS